MKLTEKEANKISKFLSLVLRHKPEELGIELNSEGWTNTAALIKRLKNIKSRMDIDALEWIVETNNKKRFAFNEDKSQIRASQGHSLKVDLKFNPIEPPEFLYHGTAKRFLHSIFKQGLDKRTRQHVHLSDNQDTALNVGSRHGEAIILTIKAKEMYQKGYKFYLSANGVWLTNNIPKEFITL